MQNEVENQAIESSVECEVCGDRSYPRYVVIDTFLRIKIDDPKQQETLDREVKHRFCQAHFRAGKVTIERESENAYFARLRATEGSEI